VNRYSTVVDSAEVPDAATCTGEDRASDRDLQTYRKPTNCGEKRVVVTRLIPDGAHHVRVAFAIGLPKLFIDWLKEKVELLGWYAEFNADIPLYGAVVDDCIDMGVQCERPQKKALLRGREAARDDD